MWHTRASSCVFVSVLGGYVCVWIYAGSIVHADDMRFVHEVIVLVVGIRV